MTEVENKKKRLITPEGRASFPFVIDPDPKKKTRSGAPKWSITLLFKKGEDLSELKKAATQVLVDKFGPDKTKWPKKMNNPFIDQGDYDPARYEGYEPGAILIRCNTERRPGVVGPTNETIIDQADIYPGCWVKCSVNPYWYDVDGNKGITFGLGNVQKRRDDKQIGGSGGARAAADEFEPVEGSEDDFDTKDNSADSVFD